MRATLVLLKQLHAAAGFRLYAHISLMLAVSGLEGIGIFLIIPLLGMTGVFDMELGQIPLVSTGMAYLSEWGIRMNLAVVLAVFVLLVGGQALLQRYHTVLSESILQSFVKRLRIDTHRSLLRAKWSFFLKRRSSDFNQALSAELNRVTGGIDLLLKMIGSVAFTVIQIALAMWLSFELTAIIIGSGVTLSLVSRRFVRKSAKLGKETTQLSKAYFAGLNDHFNGMKDIKSNRLEQQHMDWFAELCGRLEKNMVNAYRVYANSNLLYRLSSVALIAGFVYLALHVLRVPGEQLLLIVLIFTRLWPRFISIQSGLENIVNKVAAFEAVTSLQRDSDAEREEELDDPVENGFDGDRQSFRPFQLQHGIACRDVSYGYAGRGEEEDGESENSDRALQHIDLFVPANKMTAIVGKSGAGKSTLIDLLMGLMAPLEGEVLIDGLPLEGERLGRLRSSIGYVAQEPFLFHGSLRDNLTVGAPNATETELWEALRFSASESFVSKLPDQLDTVIGDRGIRLSGGERQRIVLARAILRKPSVLVLDEATSALDGENELRIQHALERLKGTMTIIVIAHRLSTIRNADHVIVLESGQVIQQGGYAELARDSQGGFQRLLRAQAEASPQDEVPQVEISAANAAL
ncbi:ABC transporter ATP-binding protein [Paenibacillus sp. NPDC058071]|uniref:ABC transporter ATP-binding protein n=1 Tax=Paenibacillus sp. NPDC058071 TaxID=3346326 RepID=UPI0036DDC92B